MTTLILPTQKPVDVPDDRVQEAFLKGYAGFPKGAKIPVVSPGGEPWQIDPGEAEQAFKAGWTYDPKTVHDAQIQEQYGGPGQQAITGIEGLASGATFGASRLLERGLGVSPASMKGRREANPVTSIAGEIGGAVIPSLLSGGTGAIGTGARLAATMPEAATALGGVAERGIASLLPRLAATGIPKIAGAATIGAQYAAGNLISEAALHENGDPELTAEHALATIGIGALLGGGMEAGQQLIGAVTRAAIRKFQVPMPPSFSPEGLEQMGRKRTTSAMVGGPGGRKSWAAKIQKYYGGPAQFGQDLQELGLMKTGVSFEDNLQKADDIAQNLTPKLTQAYQGLDDIVAQNPSLTALTPESKALFYNLKQNFVEPLRARVGNEQLADKLTDRLDESLTKYGQGQNMTFTNLWHLKQDWQTMANYDKVTDQPFSRAAKKIGWLLNSDILDTSDSVAQMAAQKGLPQTAITGTALNDLNHKISVSIMASDILKDKLAGKGANRGASLLDNLWAIGGAGMGLNLFSNPLGALAGIPAGIARHIASGQGDQFISATAMSLAGIQRKIGVNLSRIGDAIGGFLGASSKAAIPAMTRGFMSGFNDPQDAFDERFQNLDDLVKSPQRMVDTLQQGSSGVSDVAPDTSTLMQAKAAQAAQFLYDKAPKNPTAGASPLFTGQWKPSDAQVGTWSRYYDAVNDPLHVVDDLAKGQVSHEGVEVLQTVYPRLLGQVQGMVANALIQAQTDGHGQLSYGQKMQLSMLFGSPVDSTVSPDFSKFLQAQYMMPGPQQGGGGGGGKPVRSSAAGQIKIAAQTSSDTEALLRRRTA